MEQVNAPKIQELNEFLDGMRFIKWIYHDNLSCYAEVALDHTKLRKVFTPKEGARVPMGDVFTSCNWMLRDG